MKPKKKGRMSEKAWKRLQLKNCKNCYKIISPNPKTWWEDKSCCSPACWVEYIETELRKLKEKP
jgi:hypothetical protein